MIGFDKNFEKQCSEYLEYLYGLAEKHYNDCADIDSLVQDTLTVLIVKVRKGRKHRISQGLFVCGSQEQI